jgi:hypothetical protein
MLFKSHHIFSTRAIYQALEDGTYTRYGYAIMYHVTVLTRFLHAIEFKRIRMLGNFSIIGTRKQAKAGTILYHYLVDSKGSTQPGRLLELVHHLMDTIVRSQNTRDDPIACLTDQVLCLASLRPNDNFGMANSLSGLCATMQHSFYDISSHIIRLQVGGHQSYVAVDRAVDTKQECSTVEQEPFSEDEDDIWDSHLDKQRLDEVVAEEDEESEGEDDEEAKERLCYVDEDLAEVWSNEEADADDADMEEDEEEEEGGEFVSSFI